MEDAHNRHQYSCRVCLISNIEEIQMAALFTTTYKHSLNINEMLISCASVSVAPNDGLPQLICTDCLANLITTYEFQTLCRKTDEELRLAFGYFPKQPNDICDDDKLEAIIKDPGSPIKIEMEVLQNDSLLPDGLNGEVEPKDEYDSLDKDAVNDDEMKPLEYSDDDFIVDRVSDSEDEDVLPVRENRIKSKSSKQLKSTKVKKKSREFPCLVCGKIFNKNYRLLRHSNVHNTYGKPYECDICKIRFASESSLVRHGIKHSDAITCTTSLIDDPSRVFTCPECPREFLKQESLSSHLKTHKDELSQKEYLCEYCPKTFSKMNLLTRHTKCHDEIKQHKCNICNRTFALGGQLIDHMNKHKGVKPHVCHVCKKGFQQSCTLKDHIRTHSGEAPFLCSECGKSFNNGSNLRQHLLRHSGIKPFECTECPSRFSCKGGLKSHMATHSGIKPYVCDICGSSFTKTYSLAKHKRIHTGERPYSCEMCDMRFNSSDHVKRHMRTHTGEKPYKCQFCERAFAQSNDLVKHTRSHVGDNTYQCKDCPAAFRLHSELRAHSKVHFLEHKGTVEHQISEQQSNNDDITSSKVPSVKIECENDPSVQENDVTLSVNDMQREEIADSLPRLQVILSNSATTMYMSQ